MALATATLSCPSARPDGPRRVILVVDDDPVVRDLVATLLKTEGYEAVVAGDGLEAFTKLNGRKPALILLDLMMPRMDGFQFAKELKRRGLQSKIPIVVLTASGLAQEAARQIGAQGYIEKPFDFSTLLEHVEQLTAA
jgi:CheY-like chemotaxis protein